MFSAVMSFIGTFLSSSLGPPVFMLIGAVSAGASFMAYFYHGEYYELYADSKVKIERAETNTRTVEKALETTKKSLADLQLQRQRDEINRQADLEQTAKLRVERDKANAKYDSYRKRLPGVMAKKGTLIARRANKSTRLLLDKFKVTSCRTGCNTGSGDSDSTTIKQ